MTSKTTNRLGVVKLQTDLGRKANKQTSRTSKA
jgi:hypothetical protein